MTEAKAKEKKDDKAETKTCFVIMPISDADGYEAGHFRRVYEHIIRPACIDAGFEPQRADDINTTNHIIIDILKRIIEADMAICDLSSRNPNVLYELGIRQAFNLPVTLIKDERTSRIFDIQTLRDVVYDSNLRVDKILEAVSILSSSLRNTYEQREENVNSIIQLLGIEAAHVNKTEISKDTDLILHAIKNLGGRISRLERSESLEREYINTGEREFITPFRNEVNTLTIVFESKDPDPDTDPQRAVESVVKYFPGEIVNMNSSLWENGFQLNIKLAKEYHPNLIETFISKMKKSGYKIINYHILR